MSWEPDFNLSDVTPHKTQPANDPPIYSIPDINTADRPREGLSRTGVPVTWIIIAMLAALCGWLKFGPDGSGVRGNDSEIVDVDPGVVLEDAYLVFVAEGMQLTEDQDNVYRSALGFVSENGMIDRRFYDQDQAEGQKIIADAKKRGLYDSPPFVALVKDQSVTHTAKFPTAKSGLKKGMFR